MADKPVQITTDPKKDRLREIQRKPVMTPQERDEAIKLLMEKVLDA